MTLKEPKPITLPPKSARARVQPTITSGLEILVDGRNVVPSSLHIYEGDKR